jgi:hypothetical protein
MVRFSFKRWMEISAFWAGLALAQVNVAQATDATASTSRMNCGAQIECVTPDGHFGRISRLPVQDPTAIALIMEDDTVTCVLQEGETNFVIELPDVAVPDRFMFLNENGKARGELKIAVSNQRLASDSTQWMEVEGVIPFAHKRLFGVSLLGIEAKYVRLSFRVDKEQPIANSGLADQDRRLTEAVQPARPAVVFSTSALNDALNSTVTPETRPTLVLLGSIVSSVAPLRLTSN